jgi:hypothetical protein|nr:MAG TPA: hypothetical protein [Caudoviricetes sp.]
METETLNPQIEESAEMTEVAEPSEVEVLGEEEQEVAETAKTEQDAAFAQMRRHNEELERQLAEAQKQSKEYEDALGLFFDGEDKAIKAQAYYNERPFEEVKAETEMQAQLAALQNEKENLEQQLLEQQAQAQMDADLAEIQKSHPEVKSIDELGQEYLAFRFNPMGEMGAEQAFQMMMAYKGNITPKKPPIIGNVSTTDKPQSDYYTREEVEAMSPAEVKANYDRIRESIPKW